MNIESAEGVPSTVYTRDYYENCCQGYDEFNATRGEVLPRRLQMALDLVSLQPGMQILDIGCGRGELLRFCAELGLTAWGIDYAEEALNLASEMLAADESVEFAQRIHIMRASALDLPAEPNSMDYVFMLDVVEHLYPHELQQALDEARRVLKPGGKILVHTMPNLWYYRWGYPIYRWLQGLRGEKLPSDPRARWDYSDVHVNEQTPRMLRGFLRRSNFRSRVWLKSTQSYQYEKNWIVRLGMGFVTRAYPFRWVFCNDIFAVGTK